MIGSQAKAILLATLTACGFAAACGTESSQQAAADLPAVPTVTLEAFPRAAQRDLQDLLAAVRAAPLDPGANGRLARALHAAQQYQAAEALYARAAALEPGALNWPYYLGVVRASQGNYAGARDAFERAAAIDPGYTPLRRRLAATLLDLNESSEAERIYRALLAESPKDPTALFGLGKARAAQGDAAGAIESLGRAVEMAPAYAAAHYELALAYRDQGEDAPSRRHLNLYERHRRAAPPESDPLMAAVNALKSGASDHIARAIALERKGDLEGAIAEHLEALAVDPAVPQAHVNLVALYGRAGDMQKASEHYREALAAGPAQADLHYNFGVLMFESGRLPEAKAAFEQAVASNPDYAAAQNNLGQIAEHEGRLDEAITRYRRALDAQPGFRLARFHLGRMLLAKHEPHEAAQHLQHALEPRDAMTPHVLFALAVARVQQGDAEGARKLGGDAIQMAEQTGQPELARKIGEDLATLP